MDDLNLKKLEPLPAADPSDPPSAETESVQIAAEDAFKLASGSGSDSGH